MLVPCPSSLDRLYNLQYWQCLFFKEEFHRPPEAWTKATLNPHAFLRKPFLLNQWMSYYNLWSILKFAMGQWVTFKPLTTFGSLERIKNETNSRSIGSNFVKLHRVRLLDNTKPSKPNCWAPVMCWVSSFPLCFSKYISGFKILLWGQTNFHLEMTLPEIQGQPEGKQSRSLGSPSSCVSTRVALDCRFPFPYFTYCKRIGLE